MLLYFSSSLNISRFVFNFTPFHRSMKFRKTPGFLAASFTIMPHLLVPPYWAKEREVAGRLSPDGAPSYAYTLECTRLFQQSGVNNRIATISA